MNSLFTLSFDIDSQYIPMINDLLRIFIIQIVAQCLFSLSRKEKIFAFLSEIFIQTISYLLVGVLFYWLVVHKIVQIRSSRQTQV